MNDVAHISRLDFFSGFIFVRAKLFFPAGFSGTQNTVNHIGIKTRTDTFDFQGFKLGR